VLTGPDGAAKSETRATAAWALDRILALLHPFMPFITEELWRVTAAYAVIPDAAQRRSGIHTPGAEGDGKTGVMDSGSRPVGSPGMTTEAAGGERRALLVLSDWPSLTGLEDDAAEAEIGWVVDLVTAIRSLRAEMNIAPATPIPVTLAGASAETKARAGRWAEFVKRLARTADIGFADAPPPGSVQLLIRGEIAALPLKGVIDFSAERTRLEKEMQKVDSDIKRVDAKLGNPQFVERAPEEVVEEERDKRDEAQARRRKIVEALERLQAAT